MARSRDEIKALTDALAAERQELEALAEQSGLTAEQQRDLMETTLKEAEAMRDLRRAGGEVSKSLVELNEDIRQAKSGLDEYNETMSRSSDIEKKFAGASKDLGKELAGLIPVIGGNTDVLGSFGGKLAAATSGAEGFAGGMGKVLGSLRQNIFGLQGWSNLMHTGEELLAAYITSSIALGIEIQSVTADFNEATGMMGKYDDQIYDLMRAQQDAGVSFEEAAQAHQRLIASMTRFTALSKTQQETLSTTTAILNELGVATDTTTQNLHIMTTSLGMNAIEAEETTRRLQTAALAIGVLPEEMASDFAAAGKEFASFGDQAIEVFLDLKEMAKVTGIELTKLLSITEQFTTFSGAADHVGRLNALLGGPFLNTIDMVNLSLEDPAAAMMQIRDAVLDAGMSFETMNPAMRRAVAEAAGLESTADLMALMSGDMEALGMASSQSAMQLEELKEATKFTQTFSEELEATRLAFTANLAPIINDYIIPLLNWMQEVAETLGTKGTIALTIGGGLAMIVAGFIGMRMAMSAMTAPVRTFSKAVTEGIDSMNESLTRVAESLERTSGESIDKMGDAIKEVSENSKKAGPSILAVGAAILMIGGGIYFAAIGMAQFVKAFAGLGDAAWAAVAGITVFSVAFLGFVWMLSGLAASPATWAGVGVLLAIGAAVTGIGAGIQLATTGMATLISSIGDLAGTAGEFVKIAEALESMNGAKLMIYTNAMSQTAAVANSPMGAAAAAMNRAAGGGGKGAPQEVKVDVDVAIEGSLREMFKVLDKRYAMKNKLTPQKKTNEHVL